MKHDMQSPALASYLANEARMKKLSDEINAIEAHVSKARDAIADAERPTQQAQALKSKRRSMLGRLFLGRGDAVEVDQVDSQIATAEAQAVKSARTREGAEAAIEELRQPIEGLSMQINELHQHRQPLMHAAYRENAHGLFSNLVAAADAYTTAYAAVLGACRATDAIAKDSQGQLSYYFGSELWFNEPPLARDNGFSIRRDLSAEIAAGMRAARQKVEGQ